jgi:hypothetical protein
MDVKGSELQNWLWHGGTEGNQNTVYLVTHPLFEEGTFLLQMRSITTVVSVLLFRHVTTVKCSIRIPSHDTICCFCAQPSLSKLSEGTVAEHWLGSNHNQNTAQYEKGETFCSFV